MDLFKFTFCISSSLTGVPSLLSHARSSWARQNMLPIYNLIRTQNVGLRRLVTSLASFFGKSVWLCPGQRCSSSCVPWQHISDSKLYHVLESSETSEIPLGSEPRHLTVCLYVLVCAGTCLYVLVLVFTVHAALGLRYPLGWMMSHSPLGQDCWRISGQCEITRKERFDTI